MASLSTRQRFEFLKVNSGESDKTMRGQVIRAHHMLSRSCSTLKSVKSTTYFRNSPGQLSLGKRAELHWGISRLMPGAKNTEVRC